MSSQSRNDDQKAAPGAAAPGDDELAPATSGAPEPAKDPVRSTFDRGVVACARVAAWLVAISMAISVF
ncbi:hypothetical protein KGQ96_05820, partial [Halomonas coralii]|nr:hypothetical protein [Modicisalibacter sp. R2A 31.J]